MPTPPLDENNLTGLTTPIEVSFTDGSYSRGSGFFYWELGEDPTPNDKTPHWISVSKIYVVTAKHVIQPSRMKEIKEFKYAIRIENQDHIDWHVMSITPSQLGKRLHICKNERVDVAVVEIDDLFNAEMKDLLQKRAQLLATAGVMSKEFPGTSVLNMQAGDDVLIIGYPKGFYDTFNKLPVFKTGLLNTPIGMHFNGLDAFLLDFKYYPGSSGSLIISRPTRLSYNKEGRMMSSTTPQYLFLGVYQGEEVWNDTSPESADLGLGWYYYNIEEATKNPPLFPIATK
jgi:hypothetical protein